MCNLSAPHFHDKDAARAYLEGIRWPDGPVCPHCGGLERIYRMGGGRPGLLKCGDCRKQFTVTVGTVFEGSKVPLNKWLMAVFLMCSSKKGVSSHQVHRTIGVTYKTAWFMTHRIREAMKDDAGLMGSGGGTVEADETFWGNNKPRGASKKGRGYDHKMKVFTLVERGGRARSFHVPSVTAATLRPILKAQVAQDANLMTDEAAAYTKVGREFASHGVVRHGKGEYARGAVSTNTIESCFSLLKRGLVGTFHHVGEQHLQRYVTEFDFRWNYSKGNGFDDRARTDAALRGIEGRRLMYRDS